MASLQIRPVVTAFLLRREPDGARLFIVRRSGRVGTYAGRWSGISGYLEDEPETQARREIAEETGLTDDDVSLLATGRPLGVEDATLGARWLVHPSLFEVAATKEPVPDWENVEGRWLSPAELPALDTVPGLIEALERMPSPPRPRSLVDEAVGQA